MTTPQPETPAEKGEITKIFYPNTIADSCSWMVGSDCDEIRPIIKEDGEMRVRWFQIIKDGKVVAEIKESICDIYFD